MPPSVSPAVTVTFAGSGDAFGSGGRYQACIHLRPEGGRPLLLDCGATSLSALKRLGLDPGEVAAVVVSHLHGDHFGGLPFLILDGQFSRRSRSLRVVGPPGTARRLTDAMECLFPGSSAVSRRFGVDVDISGGTLSLRKVAGQAAQVAQDAREAPQFGKGWSRGGNDPADDVFSDGWI